MQPIADYNAFFEGAKQAMADLQELNAQTADTRTRLSKLENAVTAEKKALSDSILNTVTKRRSEITRTYDEEMASADERLKQVRARREKAKTQGVKERITEETADIYAEIRDIRMKIRDEFKANGVPAFCDTGLFHAIFLPKGLMGLLTQVLIITICFFVIPWGIYLLIGKNQPYIFGLIYLVTVSAFWLLYTWVSRITVYKHYDVLKHAQALRQQIAENERRIREIKKNISADTSEEKYNLVSFDDEIAHIRQEQADITMKKQEALSTFDSVTKSIISDELTSNSQPRIDELTAQKNEASALLSQLEEARKAKALTLSNDYEVYLGKEFMDPERINALAEIINHGTATNISEAIEEYKNRMDA